MRQIKKIKERIRQIEAGIILSLYGLQVNFGIGMFSITETIHLTILRRSYSISLPIAITVTGKEIEKELAYHALLQMRLSIYHFGHWGFRKSRKLDIPLWLGFSFTQPIVSRIKH